MTIHVQGMAPLLQVFDMPTSVRFYCDLLGFEIVTSDGKARPHFDWVWLRLADGGDVMLNTAYDGDDRPDSPEPARIAAHQDVCLYFGCPDVDAAFAHVREKGIDAAPPKVAPYGMKQMYFTDPDGYQLCFQWRSHP